MSEKHKERIIQTWRERKEEGMEKGWKETVEIKAVHSDLYEINNNNSSKCSPIRGLIT